MRAGPDFLQLHWSKAGLSMDLPIFVYSHTKTSFKFLSRQGRYRAAFYVATDLLFQTTQREPLIFYFKPHREGPCFVWTYVCQGLLIIEIVICIHYLIVSSPHEVRPTMLSFHLSVNMYAFNVKSYTECHKDKKGIKKAVTGLVSVLVVLSMSDPATFQLLPKSQKLG